MGTVGRRCAWQRVRESGLRHLRSVCRSKPLRRQTTCDAGWPVMPASVLMSKSQPRPVTSLSGQKPPSVAFVVGTAVGAGVGAAVGATGCRPGRQTSLSSNVIDRRGFCQLTKWMPRVFGGEQGEGKGGFGLMDGWTCISRCTWSGGRGAIGHS